MMAPGAAGQAPVGRYRVLSKAVLKASADLDSAKLGSLPANSTVEVVERQGNRVRTHQGWTSVVAKSGTVLLEPRMQLTAASIAKATTATAADFRFPYTPYGIQRQFMAHLYESLRLGAVGSPTVSVMESPTGTGKSLSIICAALTWVREARALSSRSTASGVAQPSNAEPDWVTAFEPEERRRDDKEFQARRREKKLRRRIERRLRPAMATPLPGGEYDDEFLLEQDGDGSDGGAGRRKRSIGYGSSSSSDSDADSDQGGSGSEEDEGEQGRPQVLYCSRTHSQLAQFVREINRTAHRNAVHVTTLGSRKNLCINASVRKLGANTASVAMMNERCADLRGQRARKALKANAEAAGGGTLMSGAAAAAKKVKPPSGCGCSYSSRSSELLFEQAASGSIMDLEDMVSLGQKLHACPYYGTRRMAKSGSADVVCLPYSLLFRAEARESLGIKLRGRVVIVDEAHNLHDAINGMHSLTLSAEQFETATGQLQRYQSRYAARLKPENLQRVNQMLRTLRAMASQLTRPSGPSAAARAGPAAGPGLVTMMGVNEYLFSAGLDHVNFFGALTWSPYHPSIHQLSCNLLRFFDESQLVKKLSGFVLSTIDPSQQQQQQQQHRQQEDSGISSSPATSTMSPRMGAVREVVDFIKALTTADGNGRILTQLPSEGAPAQLRFLMLNPASFFTPLLQEVRAVILAGGTMDPLPTLAADFFPSLAVDAAAAQPCSSIVDSSRHSHGTGSVLRHFSCGHVIGPDQLTTLAVCKGPGGVTLDFRASHGRDSDTMIDELGRLLRNSKWFHVLRAPVLPNDRQNSIARYEKIAAVKPRGMFREMPPEQRAPVGTGDGSSSDWELAQVAGDRDQSLSELLANYAAAVSRTTEEGGGRGAFLSCVVGGKLSEGINFSDALGRCIVMVGMPYPNPYDPELLERQRFAVAQAGGDEQAGREYYERLCMRAVNQCIGRAIRHKDDYAAIVLLDQRYARPRVMSQLPSWIARQHGAQHGDGAAEPAAAGKSETADRIIVADKYGIAQRELCKFFRTRDVHAQQAQSQT